MPSLVLMTDDERLADPLAAARALPRGSMVVARSRDAGRLSELSRALLKIARRHGLAVLIAGDPLLAAQLGADGVHLPEARAGEAAYWRARLSTMMITASAHSYRALSNMRIAPVDAVFLSPVFFTKSHTDRVVQPASRTNFIARAAGKPVYALGGIDARNARLLSPGIFTGIAAIGALSV
jgi:thiamine-phosphate pyrophosphorylase